GSSKALSSIMPLPVSRCRGKPQLGETAEGLDNRARPTSSPKSALNSVETCQIVRWNGRHGIKENRNPDV
ncbi:hypothetical protein, partial [Paracoccus sp. SY]|uniref:hypothetical protein n=1 Tax=Paracoccus sp. SY TaxID=1330255 RepID=UPI00196179D8